MNSKYIYDIKISNKELLNKINYHIDNNIPLSVIRKGDGDNVLIGFNKIRGIKLSKYFKKLKHYNIRRYDIKFQKYFISELIKSCDDADYLGIAKDNSYSSIRKYESDIIEHYNWGNKKKNKALPQMIVIVLIFWDLGIICSVPTIIPLFCGDVLSK